MDLKNRDAAAAGIHGEQERMVCGQGERTLALQGVGCASAAAASGECSSGILQCAVASAPVGDDFILMGCVRHYKHSALRVASFAKCVRLRCQQAANCDGKRQEDARGSAHLYDLRNSICGDTPQN